VNASQGTLFNYPDVKALDWKVPVVYANWQLKCLRPSVFFNIDEKIIILKALRYSRSRQHE